ncbi:unnamed protein product [Urochloa humidicola]
MFLAYLDAFNCNMLIIPYFHTFFKYVGHQFASGANGRRIRSYSTSDKWNIPCTFEHICMVDWWGCILHLMDTQQLPRRTITYMRAKDEGNFNLQLLARRRFIFCVRSAFQLKGILSVLLREWFFGIKLCVRAG